jgi:UDP-3-O-[3-hydroxymyristoyl] N-acetylglucosamine deacetylase
LDHAIGIDENGVMNKEGLRYKDEFVRHKILDCIGDLYLAGALLKGHVKAYKASHKLHCQLLQQVFASKENYEIELPSIPFFAIVERDVRIHGAI